ncbi:MAG: serine/threonine-protein phosphatase, partial [Oscillospiraceae bacterium]|nr:serine/threonine-protein phosphatase [Oscillospiraceae bacterium]
FCANVGDSRAYVIGDDIKQITKDHTLVMSLYESGEITKDELRTNPKRNYLTKAVGVSEDLVPDYFEFEVDEDSLILLCSDGLYGNIDDDVILRTVKENHGEKIPRALVECALINGSTDNVTAAVIFPENYT